MQKTTTIYLIRHGECAGNAEERFRGRTDFPLNEIGLLQAEAIAKQLADKPLDFVFSSPLLRATQTAELVAQAHSLPVTICEGFNNMCIGIWENRLKREIIEQYPNEWKLWLERPEELHIQNAETCDDVRNRMFTELESIVKKHEGANIAVVSHRGSLKPLIAATLNIPRPYMWKIYLDNAAYSTLTHTLARGYTLIQSNCTEHLKDLPLFHEFDSC